MVAAMGRVAEQISRMRGRPRAFDQQAALDRAMMLFWQQGYEPTSLSDLSRAMGINAPSIYAAFGNKERLFLRVLDRYLENRIGEVERALQASTAQAAVRHLLIPAAKRVTSPANPPRWLVV